MNFLRTGFTSYQQALDAAEKATRQGLDNFEKATEAFEKAAQQLPKMPGAQRANKPPTPCEVGHLSGDFVPHEGVEPAEMHLSRLNTLMW